MIRVLDVCRILEEQLAPLSLQESYDNAGLQLGDPEMPVKGILISLDADERVLDEAVAEGCNLIVSHHPILFKPLRHLTESSGVERFVARAIRCGVAVYAAHTNADSVLHGVSGRMGEKLGLLNPRILAPSSQSDLTDEPTGLGLVGELPESLSETDFMSLVKRCFGCPCLRHSALRNQAVRRVALCGGSGSEFVSQAIAAGADAYVTADVKYHEFQAVDGRLLLVDAGHYETEQYTKEIFYDVLSKNITTFAVQISTAGTNPVNYF